MYIPARICMLEIKWQYWIDEFQNNGQKISTLSSCPVSLMFIMCFQHCLSQEIPSSNWCFNSLYSYKCSTELGDRCLCKYYNGRRKHEIIQRNTLNYWLYMTFTDKHTHTHTQMICVSPSLSFVLASVRLSFFRHCTPFINNK